MPQIKDYANMAFGLDSPAQGVIDVDANKSDSNPLPHVLRALDILGAQGTVKVQMLDGSQYTIPATAPLGYRIEGFIVQVFAAGTTATGLVGWY